MGEEEKLLFVRESSGLVKEVGTLFALILPIALTIGPYFHFVAPHVSSWFPGAHLTVTFGIGTFCILFEGIGTMCLMLAMPRSGAAYHFVGRGLSPIFGVMEGWRSVITNPVFRGSSSFFATKVFAGGIVVMGNAANDAAMISLGTTLMTDPVWLVVVSLAMTLIGFVFSYLNVKMLGWFVVILGIINIIALVVADLILLSTPMTATIWDGVFGSGSYASIMAATDTTPYVTLNFSAVAAALTTAVGIMWPYLIMPVAGEVAQPSRNIPLSNIGGVIGIGALFMLSTVALESCMGEFLYAEIASGTVFAGFGNFAAVILGNNPISWFVVLCPVYASILDSPSNALWVTRPFHAMAMDRMCPEIFASVHPKYHVPHISLWFWLIVQAAVVIVTLFYDIYVVIGVAFTYTFIRWQFTLVEVSLPYYRPTLWERSGAWTFLGIPLISLAGLISGGIFFYALVSFVPTSGVGYETLFTVLIYGWGQIMYMYYGAKNKARGIDMAAIFGQLPPE
jgi:amino acid transporter